MRNGTRARRAAAMNNWFEKAADAAAIEGNAKKLEQLEHVRQQMELWVQYHTTCSKLETYSKGIREKGALLVPLRFPLRPTARNRQSIEEGILRSYTRFVEDLSVLSLTTSVNRLECLRHDPNTALVSRLAGVLSLETCRVLDREAGEAEVVSVCIHFIETCRLSLIREECVALREIKDACIVVRELMNTFCKRLRVLKRVPSNQDVIVAGRAWLKTAARQGQGLSHAVHVLCRRRRMACVFDAHEWLTKQYARFTDEEVVDIWNSLMDTHVDLSQSVNWEIRRVEWLCATNAANACWDGVVISSSGYLVNQPNQPSQPTQTEPTDHADESADSSSSAIGNGSNGESWATGGALVHAPAHMGVFATLERVRFVEEVQISPFSCFMSTVRVTNALLTLLRTKRLVLNRISADYANRIAAFDFSKYESASGRIVEETFRPFGEVVGVCYQP